MRLRGIIFDLDGTLADTMLICLQAFQETLQYFGARSIGLQELYPMFGPSEEGILRLLLPDHVDDAYSRYLISYERLHQNCTTPFPGIEALLDDLRARGVRIAIVTGKAAETAEISMRFLGLSSRVERLESGFIDRGNKPELICRVLQGWGLPADQVAYVGDVLSDLHAARQAGVLPIGAAWAETSGLRFLDSESGWLVFEQVQDFSAWVQEVEN